jgi:hypothetical protein
MTDPPDQTDRVTYEFMAKAELKKVEKQGEQGRGAADLLVVTAFAEAPEVLRGEALDALRFYTQSFKGLVG